MVFRTTGQFHFSAFEKFSTGATIQGKFMSLMLVPKAAFNPIKLRD